MKQSASHTITLPYIRGDKVRIKAIGSIATVTQINISNYIQFECVWFHDGLRNTAWMNDFEIEEAPDPIDKYSYGFAGNGN